jgi:membrane protein DedA with SNARE-associated domain
VPSSLALLTAGVFSAAGNMGLATVMCAAFVGAVPGNQTGFALGRIGGPTFLAQVGRGPKRRAVLKKGKSTSGAPGGVTVFLIHWIFSHGRALGQLRVRRG